MPLRQRFACPHNDCTKSYCQQGKLNFHVKTAHVMTENTPKCSYCEKVFATQAGKVRHEANVHMGKKDHSCELCQKSYGAKNQLIGHLRSTHKTDRFPCPTCDKTYAHTLEEHRGKCGKPVAKAYECSICPMKFSTQRSKQRHETSQHTDHTNICEMCGQEFRYQFAYRRHINRKHKE